VENGKGMIPHSRVHSEEDDFARIQDVLQKGQWAQGERVQALERDMAAFIGVGHGAAVSSGTAALHLSLLSLGIGPGTEVIIPSYVCTALLNAVHYVGATPVVVDIEEETFNIDARDVERVLSDRTGAIIAPHMFGLPADMDALLSLGIPVMEDCAQSIGAGFEGRLTGALGTLAVFSLYATKMLGAGEGGLILSDRADLIEKARDLRDYDEKADYVVRYNYKLTDLVAALAEGRLGRLPAYIKRRREIADIYNSGLKDCPITLPRVPEGREHIYYRYVVLVEDAEGFMAEMAEKGIECRRPVFNPLHRYLERSGYPMTEAVWSKAVSLPLYPSLSDEEAGRVVEAVKGQYV